MNKPCGRTAAVLALACALAACAPVAPWERGVLAKPHMSLEMDAAGALRTHIQSSREAGFSAPVGEGGGCGCY